MSQSEGDSRRKCSEYYLLSREEWKTAWSRPDVYGRYSGYRWGDVPGGLVEPAGVFTFGFAFAQPRAENSDPGCEPIKSADLESILRANEDNGRESR